MITITTGKIQFPKGSAQVSAYILDPKTKKEAAVFAYTKDGNRKGTIDGLSVLKGSMTVAKQGIPADRGGKWSTNQIISENPLLVKMQIRMSGWNADRLCTFYFITREGGQVGAANFLKIPVVDRAGKCYKREHMQIMNGQFELIDVDDAEKRFEFKLPAAFKASAKKSNLTGVLEIEVRQEATKAIETVTTDKVVLADGEEVEVVNKHEAPINVPTRPDFANLTGE